MDSIAVEAPQRVEPLKKVVNLLTVFIQVTKEKMYADLLVKLSKVVDLVVSPEQNSPRREISLE